MKRTIWSSRVVRSTALFLFLLALAVPGAALAAGMGGSMGGGGGFHSSGGGGGGGGVGGSVRSGGSWSGGGGSWNRGGSWHGSNGWHGGWWGGPRFFVGVGAPFWWYPYGYAYTYPVPAYAPPVVVESAPPTYIQQDAPVQPQSYWYYCQPSQTYYPYVKECPTGWLQVVPQTTPPAR